MSLKITGLAELQAQLLQLGDAVFAAKALARAARKAFKPVLDAAKSMAPRDTGALADSLLLAVQKPKGGDDVVVVGIKVGKGAGAKQAGVAAAAFGEGQSSGIPPSRRWHFVELGTSSQPARPFLRPALDSNASLVIELLKKELRRDIQRALRRKGKK